MDPNLKFRYPGTSPFGTENKDFFYGRTTDIDQIYQSILLNSCTVLVGNSGIGKSSLIEAGLIPLIEKNLIQNGSENRGYKIIRIRTGNFGSYPKGNNLIDIIKEQVKANFSEIDFSKPKFLENIEASLKTPLGFMFKEIQLNGYLANRSDVYLIIFDQLEELFSFPIDQWMQFEEEIREMISPNVPDKIQFDLDNLRRKSGKRVSQEDAFLLQTPVKIKFLFAIRSDKMNLLVRLRKFIPDILTNPYELRPLQRDAAKEAICKPATIEDTRLSSPKFEFTEAAINKILDFLESLPNTEVESPGDHKRIDPIIIQVICRFIEEYVVPEDEDKIIEAQEFNLESILSDFYLKNLENLGLTEDNLMNVRILIEDELIFENDNRRLTIYQDVIINNHKVDADILERLVEKGLLKKVNIGTGKPYFEIAHDWLIVPILSARKQRTDKNHLDKATFDVYLQNLNEKILKNPSSTTFYEQRASYLTIIGEYDKALDDYNTLLQLKGSDDLNILFSMGHLLVEQKQYSDAFAAFQNISDLDPNNKEAYYWQGVMSYYQKENDDAIFYFEKCLKIDNNFDDAENYLGVIALNEYQNIDTALEYFLRITERNEYHTYAWYNLGVCSYRNQDYQKCREAINRCLDLNPEYANAWVYLGMLEKIDQEKAKAEEALKKAISLDPTNYYANFELGMLFSDNKDLEIPRNYFLKSLEVDNGNYDSIWNLALIDEKAGDFTKAEEWYRKAMEIDSKNASPYLFLGTLKYKLKQYHEAESLLRTAIDFNPSTEAHYNLGLTLFNLKKTEESQDQFTKTIQINPQDYLSWYQLGVIAYNKGDFQKAMNCLEKASHFNTNDYINIADINIYLGLIKERQNQLEKALDNFLIAIENNPKEKIGFYNAGVMYYKIRDKKNAENYFWESYRLDPNYVSTINYLGLIHAEKEEYANAISYYLKAAEIEPENSYSLYQLGYCYYKMNEYEKSIFCFEKCLLHNKTKYDVLNYLGVVYEMWSKFDLAKTYYERAVEDSDDFTIGWNNLGKLCYAMKDYEISKKAFFKCIDQDYEKEDCYNYLGVIAHLEEKTEKAIELFKAALELNPDYPYAYYNIGEMLFNQKKYEDAIVYFEKSLSLNKDDWEAHFFISKCYQYSSKKKALDHANISLELSPKSETGKVKAFIKTLEVEESK
jgi:tetratricopeptide (TPR) repeat protein